MVTVSNFTVIPPSVNEYSITVQFVLSNFFLRDFSAFKVYLLSQDV